jgi:hypothetical protein
VERLSVPEHLLIEPFKPALSILYSAGLNCKCNLDTNTRFTWRKKMNKTLRNTLIVVAVIVVGAVLFYGGVAYSRLNAWYGGYGPGRMMGGGYAPYQSNNGPQGYYGPGGMMNGSGYGYSGMMDGGMMGGNGSGGMMGGYGSLYGVTPLSVEDARRAVESYLASFGNDDLAIKEIMTFDNNAYAIVTEAQALALLNCWSIRSRRLFIQNTVRT